MLMVQLRLAVWLKPDKHTDTILYTGTQLLGFVVLQHASDDIHRYDIIGVCSQQCYAALYLIHLPPPNKTG